MSAHDMAFLDNGRLGRWYVQNPLANHIHLRLFLPGKTQRDHLLGACPVKCLKRVRAPPACADTQKHIAGSSQSAALTDEDVLKSEVVADSRNYACIHPEG